MHFIGSGWNLLNIHHTGDELKSIGLTKERRDFPPIFSNDFLEINVKDFNSKQIQRTVVFMWLNKTNVHFPDSYTDLKTITNDLG